MFAMLNIPGLRLAITLAQWNRPCANLAGSPGSARPKILHLQPSGDYVRRKYRSILPSWKSELRKSISAIGGKRPFSANSGNTDNPALSEGGGKGIAISGSPREGESGMGERAGRNCGRTADAGAYCRSCADRIMARALLPHFHGRWKKVPRLGRPAKSSAQPPLFK